MPRSEYTHICQRLGAGDCGSRRLVWLSLAVAQVGIRQIRITILAGVSVAMNSRVMFLSIEMPALLKVLTEFSQEISWPLRHVRHTWAQYRSSSDGG